MARTLLSFSISGSSSPFRGSHVQHFTEMRYSYLSSSRSSWMASFLILAGGSSSSAYGNYQKDWNKGLYLTYTLGRTWRLNFPLDIQGESMAQFVDMSTCMVSFWIQTSAVEATQAHVHAPRAVLQIWTERPEIDANLSISNERTWSSKHWVHSSLWTDWDGRGWLSRFNCSRWVQTMVEMVNDSD